METINLSRVPNQSFFVIVNGTKVDFRLHLFNDILYSDIWVDDVNVANSVRCVHKGWLLPKRFNSSIGNFAFITSNDEYPDADNFNDSCVLCHFDNEEIE